MQSQKPCTPQRRGVDSTDRTELSGAAPISATLPSPAPSRLRYRGNKALLVVGLFITIFISCDLAAQPVTQAPPDLPAAVSNHPFAHTQHGGHHYWLTLTGLGQGKTWRDLHAHGYWWRDDLHQWQTLPALPDGEGRLAAQLVAADGAFWFLGGYTVAEDGTEVSTPQVYQIVPQDLSKADQPTTRGRLYRPQPAMPVPVDDAVILVYQDRYLYLISGWHDVGNVNLVQVFDTQTRRWTQAEPWPGAPVFGHAGALTGNRLLVCGGAKITYPGRRKTATPHQPRDFVMSDECWLGTIRADDHRRLDWQQVAPMPGGPRYRSAASTVSIAGQPWFVFLGGTLNPYNYNGIGYNGEPSQPLAAVVGYAAQRQQWCSFNPLNPATMDHRSAAKPDTNRVILIGGMTQGQNVSARVQTWQAQPPDCR